MGRERPPKRESRKEKTEREAREQRRKAADAAFKGVERDVIQRREGETSSHGVTSENVSFMATQVSDQYAQMAGAPAAGDSNIQEDEQDQPAESMAESEEQPQASDAPAESQDSQKDSQNDSGDEAPQGSDAPAESSADNPPESSGDIPAASSASGPADSQMSSTMSSGASSLSSRGSSSDAYMRKIQLKAGAQSRYQMYLVCNMLEEAGNEFLRMALDNMFEKETWLSRRRDLLMGLYSLRWQSDVDDDFTLEEYEGEMNKIKIFRQKMGRLANKEQVQRDSDDDDSSDDSDGEENFLETLKGARKEMQYTFGQPGQ